MLYSLFLSLVDTFSFLNVFKYLTVRTGLAMFTSMIIVFIIGNPFINFFSSKKIHDPIRKDGPEDHIVRKIGTPTMGGVLILLGLFLSVFLWCDLTYHLVNFILSEHEKTKYDTKLYKINSDSKTFKQLSKNLHPNFFLISPNVN